MAEHTARLQVKAQSSCGGRTFHCIHAHSPHHITCVCVTWGAGPSVLAHLVGMEDKLAAMRLAGWWRVEADHMLGVLPAKRAPQDEPQAAVAAHASGSASGTSAAEDAPTATHASTRLLTATLNRRVLALGRGWDLDAPSLARHGGILESVSALAILADMQPVWPAVGRSLACALCNNDPGYFRAELAHAAVACPGNASLPAARDADSVALLQCRQPKTLEQMGRCCDDGTKRTAARGRTRAAAAAAAAPPPPPPPLPPPPLDLLLPSPSSNPVLCQLISRGSAGERTDTKLGHHWKANHCYTRGGGMFDIDAHRLIAAGGMRTRELVMPRELWRECTNLTSATDETLCAEDADGGGCLLDATRFVEWLHRMLAHEPPSARDDTNSPTAPVPAQGHATTRELILLLPPEGRPAHRGSGRYSSEHKGTDMAVLQPVPRVAGIDAVEGFAARSELHRQRCGGGMNGATLPPREAGREPRPRESQRRLCLRGQREVVTLE